ncbi:MAG TPA: twin transmembrane helix small protein [Burkholderiaceae bacterium]|nr:twin transmembrane helix small protein [Burkholderiaceae bacterium]
MTWIIVVGIVAVLVALASAGVFMLRRPGASKEETDKRMARALAVRVGLSVLLFLVILLAWQFGWIAPKGIPTGR